MKEKPTVCDIQVHQCEFDICCYECDVSPCTYRCHSSDEFDYRECRHIKKG